MIVLYNILHLIPNLYKKRVSRIQEWGQEWGQTLFYKNYKIIIYLLTGKLDFSLVNNKFRDI
jgi:hypothetical protein